MGFCKLRDEWQGQSPDKREDLLTDYIEDLMQDWGLNPDDYDVKYEKVPNNPNANGGFDHGSDTIYINPDLLEDEEPFNDTMAAETAAHEVRHAMQGEVYEDYGEPDGTSNSLDVGMREEDAEDFADSVVPDGLEDCEDPSEESSSDEHDEMPPPPSPAGDFNLPPGGVAYA